MLEVLPQEVNLHSPENATGIDLQLDQPLSLALAFAEGLSQQQLATCHALALHVDNCVEVCMQAGSRLQRGSVAAAGADPASPASNETSDLAALLMNEDPQTSAAIRGILLALQALGTTLISVGAALSSEVVVPLYRLHRKIQSEQMRMKAELSMLQQHEKYCSSAVGESEMWKEKLSETVQHVGMKNEEQLQRRRIPFFKKSAKRKADSQMQRALASRKAVIKELEVRSDEAAIARLNRENGTQMFKDVLQRTEALRSDVLFKVLGKCAKAWQEASEMMLWSSTSLAKERYRMKSVTEPDKSQVQQLPVEQAEAEPEVTVSVPVAPCLPSVQSGGGPRRGSGCGATASSSRISKLYQTSRPAERNRGKRRPPPLEVVSRWSDNEETMNANNSSADIQVSRSTSSFSHSSSVTPMSPSAIAAFKLLGVSDSDSEEADTNTGEVLSTDVETPSPNQRDYAKPDTDVETPSPPWQTDMGFSFDASVADTTEHLDSIVKDEPTASQTQNTRKSSLCCQFTR
eukprot:gnl/MRDRNA2_/MRDRNA2_59801_c0_seq1.p1 gnl/MRDRNA2_/MRDRNA2_59801_c0~~gnl/MRDRNA2_/MRDRNA2_59801_c0_seq1.p1  ORF type:complete len:518 (+),score=99.28 gnl/MRDRNA2_/MRDRNA2_59801_c0_seq1:75-1628(+)